MKEQIKMPLTLELAEMMADAAKAKAAKMGCSVCVAVVDKGGYVITVSKMDGCLPLAADEATNMAYTAAMFGEKGSEIVKMASRPWFQSMIIATRGRIVPADGEMPIEIDGEIVGGIAAGGASNEQDVACCLAALEALNNALS